MHGNVAEWCVDLYRKDFYASLPRDKATLNPFIAPIDNRYGYVARGGAWTDPPEKCRSAARRFSEKDWLKNIRSKVDWWSPD
jgi:formylglycine-generating enzyme required for sulfatase activity